MPINVDAFGKVIDHSSPVLTDYGSPISSPNVSSSGMVIDPSESVYGDWEDLDFHHSEINGIDMFKISLLIPGVAIVLIEYIFDTLVPLMKLLTIPALIVVLFTLVLSPNIQKLKKIHRMESNPPKFQKLLKWNFAAGFILLYPLLSPALYELTNELGETMIESGFTEGLIASILSVLFISALYILRYLLISAVVPILQWFIVKKLGDKFISPSVQKFAYNRFLKSA